MEEKEVRSGWRIKEISIMSSKSLFRCDTCAYETEISGGKDHGFFAQVETKVCTNCRALDDVLVELNGKESSSEIGLCPQCSGKNVENWDPNEKLCPWCDGSMEQGPVTVMWD